MSRDHEGEWPPYVPVAERRRKKAGRPVAERLRRKGQVLAPVAIFRERAIATTAWGQAS